MFTRFVAVLAMFFAAIGVSNARVMRASMSRSDSMPGYVPTHKFEAFPLGMAALFALLSHNNL
ncbi:MAG TPA: hypothetical protein VIT21_00520 [Chthoniobacterales bacterium]